MAFTYSTSRTILATPHAIFRAFVDPEVVVKWRAPAGMAARLLAFDPRPGGGYLMIVTDKIKGGSDRIRARFITLDPDKEIVEEVERHSADPACVGKIMLTTTMRSVADGTNLTVTADHVPSGISEKDHRAAMDSVLRNLANLLE